MCGGKNVAEKLAKIKHIMDFEPVREAQAKVNSLQIRAGQIDKEVADLQAKTDETPLNLDARAAELLASGAVPARTVSDFTDRFARLADERNVVRRAIGLARQHLQETIGAASIEMCEALAPRHAELARKMHAALATLVASDKEYRAFRDAIVEAGFDVSLPNFVMGGTGSRFAERLATLEAEGRAAGISF
jgi:hypothetical protein